MATPKAGGFKLSLAGAKGKPGFRAPLEKPVKRPRLDLGDDEPEDDNKKQEISGWDAAEGGAVELNGKMGDNKGPRIIPALPNRNWREEAKKRQLARAGVNPEPNGNVPEKLEESKVSYGLTTFKKENRESASPEPMDTAEDSRPQDDGLTEEQRLEKNALHALIHGKATDHTVIPIQSEEDALRKDIHDAPAAPTLASYEATPVEGFGAALLRGMGWKDGEEIGRDKKSAANPKEIKRRPALLGIGAKPEAAVGIELGEWGKGKGKKVAMSYNPVTLRNKHTGEKISEEELKARLEAQKLVQEEKPSRSSKYDDESDDRRREKRKERKDRDRRDDDYDSERRRDKDRRKEKEDEYSDRERRREKKKYRDDDYDDSERRREKRRDKDSRDDYDRRDKERDRDRRHRSRSPDNDDRKEKRRERDRRDRDRSRSRESDDRRKRRRDYDDDDRDERKRRHKDDRYYRK